MPGLPFLIPLTIEYPSGTALSNIQVTLRNQSTDELLTENTDSDGRVIFDCSNFSSGYTIGDIVEHTISYTAFEGRGTTTITSGGGVNSVTLVLDAFPSIPQLRYFTPKDLFTYFDIEPFASDSTTGIKTRRLSIIGEGVEADIDSDCNSRFDSGNIITQEFIDVQDIFQRDFYVKKGPIQSITTFEVNTSSEGATPTWIELTEEDFQIEVRKRTGRIRIVNTSTVPAKGSQQIRVTYTYGYSLVPSEIKQLAILAAGFRLFGSTAIGNFVRGAAAEERTEERFNNRWSRIINKYRFSLIQNT